MGAEFCTAGTAGSGVGFAADTELCTSSTVGLGVGLPNNATITSSAPSIPLNTPITP
jgi:hypothetical protein